MLPMPESLSPPCSIRSCIELLGSISIALRLVKPVTGVASLPNFCEKASERLCAGSVELGPGGGGGKLQSRARRRGGEGAGRT